MALEAATLEAADHCRRSVLRGRRRASLALAAAWPPRARARAARLHGATETSAATAAAAASRASRRCARGAASRRRRGARVASARRRDGAVDDRRCEGLEIARPRGKSRRTGTENWGTSSFYSTNSTTFRVSIGSTIGLPDIVSIQ